MTRARGRRARSAARRAPHAAAALAASVVALALAPAPARADLEDDYLLQCAGCHGADGAGVPGKVPSLRGLGALLERPGGREYLVRVPGVAQAALPDERLAALLGFVLERFAGARPAPPYGADEVGRLRALPLRDPERARAEIVARP
ncbi:MAG: cytochrome C [Myxococcota bacterium]